MRHAWIFVAAIVFVFPFAAHADAAGFPGGSVWLSKVAAYEGETVTFYTAVYDADQKNLAATVAFRVDGKEVNGKAIDLKPGASQLISFDWQAKTGTHTIDAVIRDAQQASDSTSDQAKIVVAPKPQTALDAYANAAKDAAAQATPIISEIANNLYAATEAMRKTGDAALASALADAEPSGTAVESGAGGRVLAASSTRMGTSTANAAAAGTLADLWRTTLRILHAIFDSQWLFYTFMAASILFLAWIFRRMARESVR